MEELISQGWTSANHSVDARTMNIAVPTISSSISLKISGFINSSLRIPNPLGRPLLRALAVHQIISLGASMYDQVKS
jgi:hypothetical protein